MTTDAHTTQLPGSDIQSENSTPDTTAVPTPAPATADSAPEAPAATAAPAGPAAPAAYAAPQVSTPQVPSPQTSAQQATVPQVTLPQVTVPQATVPQATVPQAAEPGAAPTYAVPPTGSYGVPPQGGYAPTPQGGHPVPPQAPQYAVPGPLDPTPGKNSYGFAIASFVIGIASILSAWTFVAPIVGLVLGILALRRNTKERTLALWGVWLNGAMLAFAAVGLVLFIGLASFGIFSSAVSYGF
ncbi:DUF4190 domain-containing protein [Leucobacter aridicollis]|uniref:DUF4190 domain-containing protein n=1 Tax=Leucobacter aridicollis TaxID=283878 RepID=UPI002106856D|nr:hypothetical protein [Leucobacter aridicollis]UTX53729.1 hypothetical protein KI794_03055 [Leucobacter aridicollis]